MKMSTSKQRTVIELFASDGFPFFGPVKETLRRKHWGGKLLQRIDYISSQKSFTELEHIPTLVGGALSLKRG